MSDLRSTLEWYMKQPTLDVVGMHRVLSSNLQQGSARVLDIAKPSGNDLDGKNICLVVGHEPGGGAPNEREWNSKLAEDLADRLEARGAEVFIYHHRTRAYSQRVREMKAGVNKHMPDADCILLMHYNDVDFESAHGHEFHYAGSKGFAAAMRDAWQKYFPWSRARQDNGILKNTRGRGSSMLKAAPAWCCLTEPFFYSNPEERSKCFNNPSLVADAYEEGIANFLLS